MTAEPTKTIAVFGVTGAQGGSVVASLLERGRFKVRALTRNPDGAARLADEVAFADLTQPESLVAAFDGVYGVFANTNSFAVDPAVHGFRHLGDGEHDGFVTYFSPHPPWGGVHYGDETRIQEKFTQPTQDRAWAS